MSGESMDGTVQCKYCDFEGTEAEVMEHLTALVDVPISQHERLSADELHERNVEPETDRRADQ